MQRPRHRGSRRAGGSLQSMPTPCARHPASTSDTRQAARTRTRIQDNAVLSDVSRSRLCPTFVIVRRFTTIVPPLDVCFLNGPKRRGACKSAISCCHHLSRSSRQSAIVSLGNRRSGSFSIDSRWISAVPHHFLGCLPLFQYETPCTVGRDPVGSARRLSDIEAQDLTQPPNRATAKPGMPFDHIDNRCAYFCPTMVGSCLTLLKKKEKNGVERHEPLTLLMPKTSRNTKITSVNSDPNVKHF